MRQNKKLIALITTALIGLTSPSPVTAQETGVPVGVGSIGAGDHVFWPGPDAPQTAQVEGAECNTDDDHPCWTYHLDVTETEPGWRLRIGLDLLLPKDVVPVDASKGRSFLVEVFAPNNDGGAADPKAATPLVARATDEGDFSGYSTELWICTDYNGCPFSTDFQPNPDVPPIKCFGFCTKPGQTIVQRIDQRIDPGRWTIRVVPTEVDQWTFRMRAKLEVSPHDAKTGPTRLLPNLRAMEPFAFTFTAPAVDYAYNPAGLPAEAPVTCTPSEYADGAHVCLRFSGGAGNHGPGDFRVHHCELRDDPDLWAACQRVYSSDGTWEDQPTGPPDQPDQGARLEYEDAHAHWHYSDFLTYELFRVTGLGRTKLAEASPGQKTGFCPLDERMVGFSQFYHSFMGTQGDRAFHEGYRTCLEPAKPSMGLSAGWGDYYEWQRPGQFIDFGVAVGEPYADGAYVLVTTADKGNHIEETNEEDNASYGVICVEGDVITLLEHGHGDGPVVKPSPCFP